MYKVKMGRRAKLLVVWTFLLTTVVMQHVQGQQPQGHDNPTPAKEMTIGGVDGPENPTYTTVITNHTKADNNSNDNHNNEDHHGDKKSHGGHHADHIQVVEFNFTHVKTPLIFGLVVIIAGLSKIGFHHANFLSSKVPESCILILLGVICGAIIYVSQSDEELNFFQPHEFFLYLLPPIILEAAFSLHDRTFTENIGSIIMFSVVGTIIACFAIGATLIGLVSAGAMTDPGCSPVQIFVFSALIVAVDPVAVLAIFQEVGVNNMLYFIVFGESLLNDGVTVVLYNVMQTFNRMDTIEADQIVLGIVKFFVVVFGGLFIGILLGLVSSLLTKYTNMVKVVEPIIIFGFAYQSYILAEMFHLSGIISIIGCGLVQMQYAFNNITNKSKLACKFFAKVMSNTCEIIIFLFLGLKVVHPNHVWNTGFVLWTTLLCIVYRFAITYIMSILINRCDTYRVRKIKWDEMFMISYGGLRGAVCFSLVALLDEDEFAMKNMFVTTTLFIIFFTVFIQGGTIKWLVKKMRVSLAHNTKDMILYEELNQHISDHLMAGIEEIVGYSGKYYLREKFDHLDDTFIRPILLKEPRRCDIGEINKYYERLMMKEHYKNLKLCGVSNLPRVESSLRAVDSSACLGVMEDDFEQRALEKEEKLREKRERLVSQRSMKSFDGTESASLQKVFREALSSSKNYEERHNIKFHDKNFVMDERRHYVSHLRNKYKKNVRLSTLGHHPPVTRALSWGENDADLTVRRTSDVKLNNRVANRAHTVDLSPVGSEQVSPVTSPVFCLEDIVFEVDEHEIEDKPLLNTAKVSTSSNGNQSDKHVTFEGTQSDPEKKSQTKAKATRAESQHAGHLLRQDAMKDSDAAFDVIQMEEMKKRDRPDRQQSV